MKFLQQHPAGKYNRQETIDGDQTYRSQAISHVNTDDKLIGFCGMSYKLVI